MIQINRLTKTFGKHRAVSELTVSLGKGEIVGLLGLNGAGKSTTLRMLSGYLMPDSGEVLINGVSLLERPDEAQCHIGYLPEGAPAYDELSVWQMLTYIAGVRGLDASVRPTRLRWVIAALALEPVLHQRISSLSKP